VDPTETRRRRISVSDLSEILPNSFLTNFNRQNDLHGMSSLRVNCAFFGTSCALKTKEARRGTHGQATAVEDVLIAIIQYVKNGKDGGLLGYRMLVDAGVIPQKDGKRNPAMEPQKPADPQPDSEQARIRMIATKTVRRAVERHRFVTEPLPEMDEVEEAICSKK
jgi:hypothetical protein